MTHQISNHARCFMLLKMTVLDLALPETCPTWPSSRTGSMPNVKGWSRMVYETLARKPMAYAPPTLNRLEKMTTRPYSPQTILGIVKGAFRSLLRRLGWAATASGCSRSNHLAMDGQNTSLANRFQASVTSENFGPEFLKRIPCRHATQREAAGGS
jgi:hypothetical protein